jgi:hypothetical protein
MCTCSWLASTTITCVLRCRPDQQMLQAMQHHIARSLHQYKHQSMATTIWALAKLSSKGSTEPASAGTTSTTSSTAKGPGGTGSTCSSELVAALVDACQSQLQVWSPRDLSQAGWGLARLGAQPSQQWCQVGGSNVAVQLCKLFVTGRCLLTLRCRHVALVVGERQTARSSCSAVATTAHLAAEQHRFQMQAKFLW